MSQWGFKSRITFLIFVEKTAKGVLSRELHFSYESRKSQRGLKSRITFLRLVQKIAKGV